MKTSPLTILSQSRRPYARGFALINAVARRAGRIVPDLAYRSLAATLALCALCGFNPQTLAATYTKTNAAADLSTGAAYTSNTVVPGTGDTILFNNTVTAAQTDTITNAPLSIGEIQVTNPGGAITIAGPDSLTLNGVSGVGIDMSTAGAAAQNLTITAPVTLAASNQDFLVGPGRTLTFGSAADTAVDIAGTGDGITVQGLGTVLLTGGAGTTSTYTGPTVVNGAELELESDGAAGPASYLSPSTSLSMASGYFLEQAVTNDTNLLQTLNGVTINLGYSVVRDARGGGAGLTIGTLARSGPGAVVFMDATNGANSASNYQHASNAVGLIGGWAFYNTNASPNSPTSFAYQNTANNITAETVTSDNATSTGWATGNNTNVTQTTDSIPNGTNTQSLTYNAAISNTITLQGTSQITSGGILMTNTVGVNNEIITGGTLEGATGADLVVGNFSSGTIGGSGSLTINSAIADATSSTALTKTGTGPLILGGNNTFTGGVYIDEGEIRLAAGDVNALNSTSPNSVTFTNGNASTVLSQILSLNGNSITISGLNSGAVIGVGAAAPTVQSGYGTGSSTSNAVLTVNNSGPNTFGGNIINGTSGGTLGLTKTGAGTLTLNGTTSYTGPTVVTAGDLVFGNPSSATLPGSSSFSVAGGSTLDVSAATAGLTLTSATLSTGATSGQTATINGLVTLNGGVLTPGAVGSTMQFGSLTLTSGNLNYSISTGSAVGGSVTTGNDGAVTVTGALTINGGVINLTGGSFTSLDSYNITYDLFNYSGSLLGTGTSALTIGTGKVNGLTYTFGTTGGDEVTLTVSGQPLFTGNWITDAATASWNTASNWDVDAVPNAMSATVNLGGAATTHNFLSRTVTLDGNQTVGVVTFTSPNGESYTIDAGVSGAQILTFDNTVVSQPAAITVNSGTHSIDSTVAVDLTSNIGVSVASGAKLTIAGVIANTNTGTLAATLTKTGVGTLVLSGANTYGPAVGTVGTNLNAGTLQVGNSSALGAGNLSFGGSATLQAGTTGLTLANNVAIGGGFTGTVDTAGNTFTLSGVVSGATGALTVASSTPGGTLILSNADTYGGGTTINTGATLQIGAGSTTGSLPTTGAILNNGALAFDRSDASTITVGNTITGSGSLTEAGGTGNILQLTAANTYSGGTSVTSGQIQLDNTAGTSAIGSGDLSISSGASVDFNGLSAAIGGLNGAGTIDSSTAGAMTLTLGGNNDGGTFSGVIEDTNGVISLQKNGLGTQTLSGNNTYTGTTTVSQGGLIIGGNSDLTGNLDVEANVGNSFVTVENNAILNTTGALQVGGQPDQGQFTATLTVENNATVDAASFAFGNNGITGNDTLTVQDSALVDISGNFDLGLVAGSTAQTMTVNLNGGTLAVGTFIKSSSHTTNFDLNGGVLKALASDPSGTVFFLPAATGLAVNVEASGAVVNTNGFNDTIAAVLAHGTGGTTDGGLTVSDGMGTGSLTLTGINTYNGPTVINSGATLKLGNGTTGDDGTIATSSGITDNGNLVYDRFAAAASAVPITGGGNVTDEGSGPQTLSSTGNGYTGSTTVDGTLIVSGALTGTTLVTINTGGTLELGAANNLNSLAPITLAGGTLQTAANESLDTLNLSSSSALTLGTNNVLNFADSSSLLWAGTLSINDWNGDGPDTNPLGTDGLDQIFFAGDDLTPTQLSDIQFVDPTVDGVAYDSTVGAVQLSDGEIVAAVPEPGTFASVLGGLGMLLVWQRNRRRRA